MLRVTAAFTTPFSAASLLSLVGGVLAVDITQPVDLGFEHAAKQNDSGHLGQEIRIRIDHLHSAQESLQGHLGRRAGHTLRRSRGWRPRRRRDR